MSSFLGWIRGQLTTLPYPEEDCSGRTVIVTGANVGLGLEAARHFVRLNAAKVILACRNVDKGEDAKRSIEGSTGHQGVVEVWQLDLASYESVKEFAARSDKLDRLDVLINNASRLAPTWELFEGHESHVTVNVISTLLLSVLLLPILRRTAQQFNIVPHVVTVASDGSFVVSIHSDGCSPAELVLTHYRQAAFPEKKAENIIQALDANKGILDRYSTTKLLQLMLTKKLAECVDASGKGHVIVNALHPGLCKTQLFRRYSFPLNWLVQLGLFLIGRDAEMGSRALMAAAFAGEETHGNWMTNCRLHVWPSAMQGDEGEKLTSKIWNELLDVLEGIQPGVTKNI